MTCRYPILYENPAKPIRSAQIATLPDDSERQLTLVHIGEHTAVRIKDNAADAVNVLGEGRPIGPLAPDTDVEQPVPGLGREASAPDDRLPVPKLTAQRSTRRLASQRVETSRRHVP